MINRHNDFVPLSAPVVPVVHSTAETESRTIDVSGNGRYSIESTAEFCSFPSSRSTLWSSPDSTTDSSVCVLSTEVSGTDVSTAFPAPSKAIVKSFSSGGRQLSSLHAIHSTRAFNSVFTPAATRTVWANRAVCSK